VGIIGRNGSGKSTLLKILSRITAPTEGSVEIRGRVGSLLEVGTGFHPELTGRENIYLNGAVIGMKKAEVERKFDEIVAFAEIEKFLDTPVKRYSSGMYVRLAFAVAAHLEPEILIVDEVLAVGDTAFQKKCLGKMGAAAQDGRTVLFVSHNMTAVKALCSRVLLLDQGTIKLQGLASQVVDEYIMEGVGPKSTILAFEEDDKLRIQFLSVQLVESIDSQSREVIQLEFKYVARSVSEDVLLCVEVRNASDVSVFYSNDSLLNETRKREKGIHKVALTIPKYLFAPGAYSIAFGFWEPGHAAEHFPNERLLFHRQEPINRLSAHGIPWPSVIYMPATWSYLETGGQYTGDDVT
jgi:lipopolysaccharide transport system ATP-binding protein